MNIFVLGISHDKTPIEIRERVFFSENRKISAITTLKQMGLNNIILSTCNRCEIYISSKSQKDNEKLKKYFYDCFGDLSDYLFEKSGIDAIYHIYNVASGLNSKIIGEDQILGQVKDALQNSIELDASDKYMSKVFREAITTAKKIKSTLKISNTPLSVSYIAVKIIQEHIYDIQNKNIVIVGTGKMGMLAINHLVELGAKNIYCCNRSYEKVAQIIKKYPFIQNFEYDDRYTLLNECDVLITSTSSPHTIIKSKYVTNREKPILMIDLSMPRDIDTSLKNKKNVTLYDIDDFDTVSKHNMQARIELTDVAKQMIEQSVQELIQWKKSAKADKTIKSLNEKCDSIVNDTMHYINRKIELKHREQKIIEKMVSSALQRLIKEPIMTLKNTDEVIQKQYISAVNELFDL